MWQSETVTFVLGLLISGVALGIVVILVGVSLLGRAFIAQVRSRRH